MNNPIARFTRRSLKPPNRRSRRGIASMLAMLYVVLISTLAVGFFAAATISAQIARNQRTLELAQCASDSGMGFARYQLGQITVASGLADSNLLAAVAAQLGAQLNGTRNMKGHLVTVANNAITLPSANDYMAMDGTTGAQFRITITASGTFLSVKSSGYGQQANAGRGIHVQFQTAPRASAIFDYGVAAKGAITMSGNVAIQGATDPTKGSVLSETAGADPLTMTGNVSMSGDFSYTNAAGTPSYGGGTIAGYSQSSPNFVNHVHAGITPPPFPTVDTTAYAQYATNVWTTSTGKTVVNCVIPPNANPNFSGGTTVQGVMYIRTPNRVSFSGNTTIQGCIVVENNPIGNSNAITFSGNVQASGINTLPANSTFPAGERALTGAFLLAPGFSATFSGNFGTIGGSMIADQFTFSGNAGGTVQGSVVALQDRPMTLSGNSAIVIASTGTSNYPTGVSFGNTYTPLPGTYLEVAP